MRHSKINRKYGCKVDFPRRDDIAYRPKIARMEAQIPVKVDLSDKLPTCWDQGQEGSCTGHGCGAAIAFIHPGFMPSRNMIYFDGRELEGDTDQDSGAQISDVISGLATHGVCHESTWPYDAMTLLEAPSEEAYQEALPQKIKQYARVSDLEDLKSCLAEGFPVVIGFSVYDNFESPEMAKTGLLTLPGPNDELLGGHCVLVTGYDESTRLCLVRNSWGTSWGLNGNFHMPYSYFNTLVSDMWVIQG